MKSIITFTSNYVEKICRNNYEFKKELYVYSKKLDFIPKILDFKYGNLIRIEKIEGQNIGSMSKIEFSALSSLICKFHQIKTRHDKVICHMDTNPKNYLFDGKKYFMIDFGEIKMNYPEIDLINFSLFYASILPNRIFRNFLDSFILTYPRQESLSRRRFITLLKDCKDKFDFRRKRLKKIDKNENSEERDLNRETLKKILTNF